MGARRRGSRVGHSDPLANSVCVTHLQPLVEKAKVSKYATLYPKSYHTDTW